jgi:hypothetical protein
LEGDLDVDMADALRTLIDAIVGGYMLNVLEKDGFAYALVSNIGVVSRIGVHVTAGLL